MKKIFLIFLILLFSGISYSQINKLKIGKSTLTDSSGILRIKSDSKIEFLNPILGNIDISGNYYINGIAITAGTGGNVYKDSSQSFTRLNTFDSLKSINHIQINDGRGLVWSNSSILSIINELNYNSSVHNFNTENHSSILQLDSNSGIILNYGDIDIQGVYKINGVPLSIGGGNVYKDSSQSFTRLNTFDSLSIGTLKSNLSFKNGDTTWIKTKDSYPLFIGVDNDTAIKIDVNNRVDINQLISENLDVASTLTNILGTTVLGNLILGSNVDPSGALFIGDILFNKGSDTYFGTVDDNDLFIQRNGSDRIKIYNNDIQFKGDSVTFDGTVYALNYEGNGSNIQNLVADNIVIGTLDDDRLTSNIPRLDVSNTFSAQRNTFKSINLISGASDTIGTGDNNALLFKVNNSPKIRIDNDGVIHYYTNNVGFNAGSSVVFGTNDNYSMTLKTNSISRILIDSNVTFSQNIILPTTLSNSVTGVLYKGSSRFLHNYTADTVDGHNLFLGIDAGNFTMNAVTSFQSSYNTGIGENTLQSLTTGYYNVGLGYNSAKSITTGGLNFGEGAFALANVTTGSNNVAIGGESMLYPKTTSSGNTMIGGRSGYGVNGTSVFNNNVGIGWRTGYPLTTGSNNIIIGYGASDTTLTTGSGNILIGYEIEAGSSSSSNTLNIGRTIYGTGMNGTGSVGIGIVPTSITSRLHLPAGTTSASSSPLKFTSGSLMTTAETGAIEFLTDKFYGTITTSSARKEITLNDVSLTSGRIPVVTTNGRLTDYSNFLYSGTVLSVPNIVLSSDLVIPILSTPITNAPAGTFRIYFKSDNKLYKLDDVGNESLVN